MLYPTELPRLAYRVQELNLLKNFIRVSPSNRPDHPAIVLESKNEMGQASLEEFGIDDQLLLPRLRTTSTSSTLFETGSETQN
jgi:hypothetical protein